MREAAKKCACRKAQIASGGSAGGARLDPRQGRRGCAGRRRERRRPGSRPGETGKRRAVCRGMGGVGPKLGLRRNTASCLHNVQTEEKNTARRTIQRQLGREEKKGEVAQKLTVTEKLRASEICEQIARATKTRSGLPEGPKGRAHAVKRAKKFGMWMPRRVVTPTSSRYFVRQNQAKGVPS